MKIAEISQLAKRITDNVERVIVGKKETLELMLAALVAGGHPYDFVMPAAAFRSGKEYVYTLKTAGNGVEIEDITITGWQPGGNYEGTITEKEQERQ